MTRLQLLGALLGALLVLCVPGLAQTNSTQAQPPIRKANAKGGHRQALLNLPVPAIDAITPLSQDQKVKIEQIHTKLKADLKAAGADPAKKADLRRQAAEDLQATLNPDQVAALNRAAPMLTMLNASHTIPYRALPEVKLTRDQMDKIQEITLDEQAKLKGLKGLQPDDRRAKTQEIRADFKTRVEALLTAEQKTALATAETARPHGRKAKLGAGT